MVLDEGENAQDDEVPDRRHHQERDHLEIASVDDLDGIEQLRQRQDVDLRGALRQQDDLVEAIGQDSAHRLRQHDSRELAAARQAERGRCLMLALVDREDAAAHDLRGEGAGVQSEPEHCREERRDQLRRRPAREGDVGEGNAEPDRRIEITEIVEDQQQHDQRDRAEQPNIGPGQRGQQRRAGDARQSKAGAEQEAENGAEQGQQQGSAEPCQHRLREEPFGEDVPTPAWIGQDRVRDREDHDDREDGADGAGRITRRHDPVAAEIAGRRCAMGARRQAREIAGEAHGWNSSP
jgi:hypothetical protein